MIPDTEENPSRPDSSSKPPELEFSRAGASDAQRLFLMGLGFFFTGLAVTGFFLPLLPGVPFALAAAWCFSRSSERFYRWILYNRWFGHLVRDYYLGQGIPIKAVIMALVMIWTSVTVTVVFAVQATWQRALLAAIAAAVSLFLIYRARKPSTDTRAGNSGASRGG